MNKNIWIIANWKARKTIAEALDWLVQVGFRLPKNGNIKAVVCPTFSALSEVQKAVQEGGYPLLIGSQGISSFTEGPFTGEEPGNILKQFINLSIIGHSERRQNFSETDADVEQKVKIALDNKITPLVCIQGKDTPVPGGCRLVAYEPVFAIGTGTPDTAENAQMIAKFLKNKYGNELEVLYGGSINKENVNNFLKMPDISGVLVGKASLNPDEFIKIVEEAVIESSKT